MYTQNLSRDVKWQRVVDATAAGTSDVNSSSVDCANHEGVVFTAAFGTLTATQVTTLKAQQSDDNGVADGWSDLEGSQTDAMADDDDNQLAVLAVHRPRKRYVRCVVERDTANAVIDGVVAQLYGPRTKPATDDSATVSTKKTVISPAEGTA